jgi:Fe-S-cluster containining protein
MSHDFQVCLNCRFHDEMDSTCKRYPPVYTGERYDEKEQMNLPHWTNPHVDLDWAEWCGEWQPADPEQSVADRREQIRQKLDAWAAENPELVMRAREDA